MRGVNAVGVWLLGGDGAEDFLHGAAFGEFVDEFVEVADFAHEGVFDFFDPDAADDAFDLGAGGIEFGGFVEEGFEVGTFFEMFFEGLVGVSGQPSEDLIDFGFGASFLFGFGDVVGVDARDGGGVDPVLFVHEGLRVNVGARVNVRNAGLFVPSMGIRDQVRVRGCCGGAVGWPGLRAGMRRRFWNFFVGVTAVRGGCPMGWGSL